MCVWGGGNGALLTMSMESPGRICLRGAALAVRIPWSGAKGRQQQAKPREGVRDSLLREHRFAGFAAPPSLPLWREEGGKRDATAGCFRALQVQRKGREEQAPSSP